MMIGIILALIDLGFCVFIMYYCCKYEKRLDEFECLYAINSEEQKKFRADINHQLDEHRLKINQIPHATIYDTDGNLQEVTIDELADYVLNDEPIIRKVDKAVWRKDENKSNI